MMGLTEKDELELLELEEQEYQASKNKNIASDDSFSVGDAAKKLAQGFSAGYLPRFAGALETTGQAIGVKGLGSPDLTDIGFQKPELLEPEKLKENYEQAKLAYENTLNKASEKSPVLSGALEIAGGLMTPIPGGAATTLTGKALKGAGMGAVAGYGYSQDDDEKLARMGTGALLGGTIPIAAEKVISPAFNATASGVGKIKDAISKWGDQFKTMPKQNADEIIKASEALGFEPTKAMLSDSRQIQTLEEGLTKGGGIFSTPYIEKANKIYEGLKNNLSKLTDKQTGESIIASGEKIAQRLTNEVDAMTEPTKKLYQQVQKDLQNTPVDKNTVNTAFAALKRNDMFRSVQGKEFLEKIKTEVQDLPDIPSLMNYTRRLWQRKNPVGTIEENGFIDAMYGSLKGIRDNSINALKNNEFFKQAGKSGQSVIDNTIDTLTLADAAHASNIGDINSVREIMGSLGKKYVSPKQFKSTIAEKQFEQIGEGAKNVSYETLLNIKNKFPSVFEKAKETQVNDLIERSMTKGEMDLGKFIRNVKKVSPEMLDLIFDKETNANIKNLETVYNSIPGPINPSNTSGMQRAWESLSSPTKAVRDYIASKALDKAGVNGSPFANKATMSLGEIQKTFSPGGTVYEAPRKVIESTLRSTQPLIEEKNEKPLSTDKGAILDRVKGSPYEQVLKNALQNGGDKSFAAANYVLKNRDSRYKKLFESEA